LLIDLPRIEGAARAKRPEHLPVVFTRSEAKQILEKVLTVGTVGVILLDILFYRTELCGG